MEVNINSKEIAEAIAEKVEQVTGLDCEAFTNETGSVVVYQPHQSDRTNHPAIRRHGRRPGWWSVRWRNRLHPAESRNNLRPQGAHRDI